jgi:hypothetical protein
MEMYKCKPERASEFWRALQDTWIKLYGSNNIFIAAINVNKKTKRIFICKIKPKFSTRVMRLLVAAY